MNSGSAIALSPEPQMIMDFHEINVSLVSLPNIRLYPCWQDFNFIFLVKDTVCLKGDDGFLPFPYGEPWLLIEQTDIVTPFPLSSDCPRPGRALQIWPVEWREFFGRSACFLKKLHKTAFYFLPFVDATCLLCQKQLCWDHEGSHNESIKNKLRNVV